jgi:hypothetical protein
VTTTYQGFGGEFNSGGVTAKAAAFSDVPFFVGRCRMQSPTITIRVDGRAGWTAQVRTTSTNQPEYGTVLRFFDANDLELYDFNRMWSNPLGDQLIPWNRNDLAIPPYMYQSIAKVARDDYCDHD